MFSTLFTRRPCSLRNAARDLYKSFQKSLPRPSKGFQDRSGLPGTSTRPSQVGPRAFQHLPRVSKDAHRDLPVAPKSALLARGRRWSSGPSGTRASSLGDGRRDTGHGQEHSEEPWQSSAQGREVRHSMEQVFIARVARLAPSRVIATWSKNPRSNRKPCAASVVSELFPRALDTVVRINATDSSNQTNP